MGDFAFVFQRDMEYSSLSFPHSIQAAKLQKGQPIKELETFAFQKLAPGFPSEDGASTPDALKQQTRAKIILQTGDELAVNFKDNDNVATYEELLKEPKAVQKQVYAVVYEMPTRNFNVQIELDTQEDEHALATITRPIDRRWNAGIVESILQLHANPSTAKEQADYSKPLSVKLNSFRRFPWEWEKE